MTELKDWYNNIVLSIIAGFLLMICLDEKSLIDKERLPYLPNADYAILPLNEDGSINVRVVSSDVIDVNIENIDTRDIMNINIKELGGGFVKYNGPLNVKKSEF